VQALGAGLLRPVRRRDRGAECGGEDLGGGAVGEHLSGEFQRDLVEAGRVGEGGRGGDADVVHRDGGERGVGVHGEQQAVGGEAGEVDGRPDEVLHDLVTLVDGISIAAEGDPAQALRLLNVAARGLQPPGTHEGVSENPT
jgi:hypothetical protein